MQWGIIHGYACGTIYIYTYIHTYIHVCVCVCMCVYCMYGTLHIQYTCLCFAGVYLICRYVLIYTRFCENIGVWDCMEITKDIKYGLDWIGKSIHGGYPTPNKLMAFK